jgi:hypothetical protein
MARKAIDWDEVNATVEELPKLPPEDTHAIMAERGMTEKNILLYRCEYVHNPLTGRNEKMAKVTCSACGESVYMEHLPAAGCGRSGWAAPGFFHCGLSVPVRHGDSTICHECGKAAEAVQINYVGRGGYEIDSAIMLSTHKVRGHLCVLDWKICRVMMPDGTVHWRDYRGDGVLVVGGKTIAVSGYYKSFRTISWGHPWEARKQFVEKMGKYDAKHILPIPMDFEDGTDSEKSGFGAYMAEGLREYYPGAYLRLWQSHKNVENLARQGLRRYLNEVIDKSATYGNYYSKVDFSVSLTEKHINWKKVKPHEMLGIDKQDLWVAKTCSMEVVQHFAALARMSERGVRLTPEQLAAVEEIGVRRVITAVEDLDNGFHVSEVKMLNYLIKQQGLHPGCVSGWGMTLLTDYWKSCRELNGGTVPKSLQWPKDLKAAHDDMTARVRYKEDAELAAGFETRCEEMREYAYESPELGMSIRICSSQAEMITEGKVLNHCVGRYAKDHANGKTTIFLIRRIEEPDKPYYTLEWKNGAINQNHTESNHLQTEEVLAFEREWLAHVAEIEKKKKKKGTKVNGTQDQPTRLAV